MKLLGICSVLLIACSWLEAGTKEIEKAIYCLKDVSQLNSIPSYIDPYQFCGGGCGSPLTITADHLFTYNELDEKTEYPVGSLIPFNGLDVVGGTAITHPTPEQFFIYKRGRYLVTFMGATNNDSSDSVSELTQQQFQAQTQIFVNGSPIGASLEVNILGAMVVNQVIVPISALPGNISLRVTDEALLLNTGNSATLSIIRISPQP